MPISSRWMPLATILVLGLAVGGASESVVAAVGAAAALGGLLAAGRGPFLPLAAVGAFAGFVGTAVSPRTADALTLRPVAGGYALTAADGRVLHRGAKQECLRAAARNGALRVVVR